MSYLNDRHRVCVPDVLLPDSVSPFSENSFIPAILHAVVNLSDNLELKGLNHRQRR
jgi:hypothetical protein